MWLAVGKHVEYPPACVLHCLLNYLKIGPVERCSESRNPTVPVTEQSYRYVHYSELYIQTVLLSHFLSESALVEYVRPMKVDQLCVIEKLVKESTSTSVMLEVAHNHGWLPHWILWFHLYLIQPPTDVKTWSDMYYVSTTTHLVALMEPSHLQFPFVLRNAFMFNMNVPMHGTNLKV